MSKDYVPVADAHLSTWLKGFKQNVTQRGALFGLSTGEIAQAQTLCSEYSDQILTAIETKNKAKSENSKKKAMRKTHLQPLRKLIRKMKSSTGFGTVGESFMNIKTHNYELDTSTYKPELKLIFSGDAVVIRFKKRGIQGLEIWVKINDGQYRQAFTRSYSPAHFIPEGFAAGEVLRIEIKAIAIKKDKYFGQWSVPTAILVQVPSR